MIRTQIIHYIQILIFLIPLGIIGFWRWLIWLIKRIVSLFYKIPKTGKIRGSLAVVTPVYNENPKIFLLAIDSWLKRGLADEVIAVIDYSDTACISVFQEFVKKDQRCKLIITKIPGKRQALVDGVRKSHCGFVALTDSDTIWASPVKTQVLGVFSDQRIGGIATRQDVYQPDTLAKRLFRIHLSNRYLVEMPFLASIDDALTCISGRTAIYRRKAILPELDALANEKFLGKQVISGDDKTLTRLIQKSGWKVKYFKNVCVLTPGFEKVYPFIKQMVRWNRNSWRSDIQSLGSSWLWKDHKILGLYMLDRFVQPFTLLLGAIYLLVALEVGYWQVPIVLMLWWAVSRSVKIFPHLRRHPKDIALIPAYVLFSYIIAVLKIYALITLNTQGWITRWHSDRLKKNIAAQVGSALLTIIVLGGYFGGVSWYQHGVLQTMLTKRQLKNTLIFSSGPRMFNDASLKEIEQQLFAKSQNENRGYYALKRKDTLTGLQNRFNLKAYASIGVRNNPTTNRNMLKIGQSISIPASEMQSALNAEELLQKKKRGIVAPYVWYEERTNTIRVKGIGSIVTLSDLEKRINGKQPIVEHEGSVWTLKANLYLSKGVTLVIDDNEVSHLRLKSDEQGYVWILGQGSNILISDTKITSWNENANQPDYNQSDGRSFIVAKGSGRMDVLNSEIAYLGMVGEKRGGAFGGSYGLSWKIPNGTFNSNLLTGVVRDSNIHHNYFGIYTYGVTGMRISGNMVHENEVYGIDPHDDSNNMVISENTVFKNGKHGIIISKRCKYNQIVNNISRENGYHGIMVHADSNNNIVSENTVFGNHDGIVVYGSSQNVVTKNNVENNKQGIRVSHGSQNNYIRENTILRNQTAVHMYKESNDNYVIYNRVFENKLGVSLQESHGNAIYENFGHLDNQKDGSIALTAQENEIQ